MIDETNVSQVDETENNNSAPSGKKKYCEKCYKQYDASNTQCPYCGHKNKHTALKVAIGVMVGGTIIFGVIPDIAKDKGDDSSSVPDRAIVTEADTTAETTTIITTTKVETTITENTTTTIATTTTAGTTITVTATEPERKLLHFVVNTDSHCAHSDPYCSAAATIVPENYAEIDVYEDELSKYSGVYWACGKCSIRYRDILYPLSDDE